jgi:anti-anti-sigma factor
MTFVYTVNRAGRRVSVITGGEMDVTAAGPFGAVMCDLAQSEPTELIEIDLGGLMFIDSTGIAALNRAYRTTSRIGCTLVVTKATGAVLRALELTGALAHLEPCGQDDTGLPRDDTGLPRAEADTGRLRAGDGTNRSRLEADPDGQAVRADTPRPSTRPSARPSA